MEFIKLQNNKVLKNYFCKASSISQFYSYVPKSKFKKIKQFAQKMITGCASTYVCERTFFVVMYRKSKRSSGISYRRLNSILRISTLSLQTDIDK